MAYELYYATGNSGKFGEVKEFMQKSHPEIELKQVDVELEELQTLDQQSIARSKAQQAWRILQKPVIVDDAGLYFEAYNRFPGTLTKFVYQGIGLEGILKLVEHDHRAYYLVYIAYADGPETCQLFEGRCYGSIVPPRDFLAPSGLPFDDIFVPQGSDKTYAQLRKDGYIDQVSARIQAVRKFLSLYKK